MPRRALLVALTVGLAACSIRDAACGSRAPANAPAPAAAQAAGPIDPSNPSRVAIAFLGDSLTAGFGLLSQQAFPALIEAQFTADGYSDVDVINGGVSGDTTAGALRRAENLLEPGVRILVVALGGNDALRGLTTKETHDNLDAIIKIAQTRGVAVMLCGMEAPPNLGEDYQKLFRDLFLQLLRENRAAINAYVPFLLEGVAGNPTLNQPDGIHPTQEGAKVIATALYPKLREVVDRLPGGGGPG